MTALNIKGKNIKTSLLNTYSIEEIISIFTDIENSIISLRECSSDDFLNLNAYFKKYYKQSKIISENASHIFDIIAGKDNNVFFTELNAFHEKLKIHVDSFEKQINKNINILEKIITNLNLLFVPQKNFKQNLMTLKFLVANLKLNITYSEKDNNGTIDKETNTFDEFINKTKTIYPVYEENLNQLKSSIKKTLSNLEIIKGENVLNIETILNQTQTSISLLKKKHEEVVTQIPELTQNIENSSEGMSKIITNLQYQDIIKQKIDHIQQTHKDIIKELTYLEDSEDEKVNLHNQVKCFLKIRDIAGLQAAQLIHANKEYQTAIEIITNKFLEIGEVMTTISAMCQQFSGHTYKAENNHFNEINSNLQKTIFITGQITKSNQEFKLEVETINEEIKKLSDNLNEIKDVDQQIELLIQSTINKSFTSKEKKNESLKTIAQIEALSSDIHLITNNMHGFFGKTLKLNKELNNNLSKYCSEHNINKDLSEVSNNAHGILKALNENNEKVNKILLENNELRTQISKEIKYSVVEQVKYYDFFEKVIEEIISELNTINYKLKSEDSDIDPGKEKDNLKHLKDRYTMKSEHLIHETISEESKKGTIDIFETTDSISAGEVNEDDDNLELF